MDIAKGLAQVLIDSKPVTERAAKVNKLIEDSKIKDFLIAGLDANDIWPDEYWVLTVGDFANHDESRLPALGIKRFNDFKAALAELG